MTGASQRLAEGTSTTIVCCEPSNHRRVIGTLSSVRAAALDQCRRKREKPLNLPLSCDIRWPPRAAGAAAAAAPVAAPRPLRPAGAAWQAAALSHVEVAVAGGVAVAVVGSAATAGAGGCVAASNRPVSKLDHQRLPGRHLRSQRTPGSAPNASTMPTTPDSLLMLNDRTGVL